MVNSQALNVITMVIDRVELAPLVEAPALEAAIHRGRIQEGAATVAAAFLADFEALAAVLVPLQTKQPGERLPVVDVDGWLDVVLHNDKPLAHVQSWGGRGGKYFLPSELLNSAH